jgi:hypothetical protein
MSSTRRKRVQPSLGNKMPIKPIAGKVAKPEPVSNLEKAPYLNENGLMDLNQVPDDVWRRWRRWKRLPRSKTHPAFGPRRKRR